MQSTAVPVQKPHRGAAKGALGYVAYAGRAFTEVPLKVLPVLVSWLVCWVLWVGIRGVGFFPFALECCISAHNLELLIFCLKVNISFSCAIDHTFVPLLFPASLNHWLGQLLLAVPITTPALGRESCQQPPWGATESQQLAGWVDMNDLLKSILASVSGSNNYL